MTKAPTFQEVETLGRELWPGLDDVLPVATLPIAASLGENHFFMARACGQILVCKGKSLSVIYDMGIITDFGFKYDTLLRGSRTTMRGVH